MAAPKNPHRRWDLSHNPMERPLGCNGKYGGSGMLKHQRKGEKVCRRCLNSKRHYNREYSRKGIVFSPRVYERQPCGTAAAAARHRKAGEPRDYACKVAEAQYKRDYRKRIKEMA